MSQPDDTTPQDPVDLGNRQMGDFHVLRRLGRGAMADVYLAEQCSLRRQVALKVLKSHLATDPTYIARFQREAQAAASLVHANIVQIHEVGCIDGIHFIAQEYIQGENLRQWAARHGPPNPRTAVTIMRQVAAALAKAAEQGIVHRDIKPENIMITRSGEVKVADFGLARLPSDETGVGLTQVGMTLGTPLYMSPEQIEGRSLDPRSDIYSFGVTCYQMLAGKPPFQGETVLSVAVQHLKKRPEPLADRCPHLPGGLCRIVHRMLAKQPDKRYQSARDLLADLRTLQAKQGAEEPLPAEEADWDAAAAGPGLDSATRRLQASMEADSAPPRRSRWGWWVAATTAVAALVGGASAAVFTHPEQITLAAGEAPPMAIPQQENVLRQWYYASEIGTEEAWWSVIDYFPEKQYMVYRAKQQLARIYLREGKYDQAMTLFEEFAFLGVPDAEIQAFGLAGQCGVLALQGHYRESAAVLAQLWPIRSELRDPQMRQMLSHVVKKIHSELGVQTTEEWQHWLDDQFREDG